MQEFGVDSIFFVVLHDIARKFLPLYWFLGHAQVFARTLMAVIAGSFYLYRLREGGDAGMIVAEGLCRNG